MVNEFPPRFLPTVLQIHPPKGPPRLEVIVWCQLWGCKEVMEKMLPLEPGISGPGPSRVQKLTSHCQGRVAPGSGSASLVC